MLIDDAGLDALVKRMMGEARVTGGYRMRLALNDLREVYEQALGDKDDGLSALRAARDLLSAEEWDAGCVEEIITDLHNALTKVKELEGVLAYIDAHAPLADESCLEPGITLSEAARRSIQERDRETPDND